MSTTAATLDTAAIARIPSRIMQAWAYQDAQAFAEVFTDDGTMILPGVYRKGKDAIAQFMAQAFAGPYAGTQVTGTPFEVRAVTDDVALLLTEGGVIPADAQNVPDAATVRGSWLVVRDGEDWKLAAYQNTTKA